MNDTIPSIKPDQDEVASYRSSARSAAPRQSNFNGLLVFVIVLMAIIMGIGGYTLFEVQKKLDRSNALLAQGQMNIAELDSRLAATGTDVSQTLQDLKDQVGTNFSEIDKLWAVSYRQNKPDIQKNVRSIKTLKDDLGQSVTNMAGSVDEMYRQYKELVDEYSGLRDGLLQDNQEFITEIAFLRSQVQDQAVVQEANQRALNTVSRQLKEVNEAISSIDQHRQQLAQKLSQQQTQIQGIQARATNGTDG
jgi:chromosome segregation ATPase